MHEVKDMKSLTFELGLRWNMYKSDGYQKETLVFRSGLG